MSAGSAARGVEGAAVGWAAPPPGRAGRPRRSDQKCQKPETHRPGPSRVASHCSTTSCIVLLVSEIGREEMNRPARGARIDRQRPIEGADQAPAELRIHDTAAPRPDAGRHPAPPVPAYPGSAPEGSGPRGIVDVDLDLPLRAVGDHAHRRIGGPRRASGRRRPHRGRRRGGGHHRPLPRGGRGRRRPGGGGRGRRWGRRGRGGALLDHLAGERTDQAADEGAQAQVAPGVVPAGGRGADEAAAGSPNDAAL